MAWCIQIITFDTMNNRELTHLIKEQITVASKYLKRDVTIEMFLPLNVADSKQMSLLLINDGQDMPVMHFDNLLNNLYAGKHIAPLCCAAIACSDDRMMEYGVAAKRDYMGRGAKAKQYTAFVLKELLPYIKMHYNVPEFKEIAIAGFSLGGLSALDIAWQHPTTFNRVGIFSGSLWWRSINQSDKKYDDNKHRIMQQIIRRGLFVKEMKFFFQTGKLDETADRNQNGIIDAIEDTVDHIHELMRKGYTPKDIVYIELEDGRHDVPTWARAMSEFLKWGWGNKENITSQ